MRTLFESAPNGFVVVNDDGIIQLINTGAEKLFGYKSNELIGKGVECLVPERHARNHQHLRATYQQNPQGTIDSSNHGLFLFSWKESGGPPVSPPTKKGFGSVILKDAAQQLGLVTLDYPTEGFAYLFRVKLVTLSLQQLLNCHLSNCIRFFRQHALFKSPSNVSVNQLANCVQSCIGKFHSERNCIPFGMSHVRWRRQCFGLSCSYFCCLHCLAHFRLGHTAPIGGITLPAEWLCCWSLCF
jgi:PAS fold